VEDSLVSMDRDVEQFTVIVNLQYLIWNHVGTSLPLSIYVNCSSNTYKNAL